MSKKSGSKSKLTYLHEKTHKEIKNDTVTILEEEVKDGPKGISFKFYQKKGGNILKVKGYQAGPDGNFKVMITKDGDKKESTDLSLADVIKMIKTMKDLDFAVKYLSGSKKQTGGYYHYTARVTSRGKRKSKKGSKKGSKKRSRKGYRKGSRKGSKKTGRVVSRKGSKKRSRKASRKASKKSRKRSRK